MTPTTPTRKELADQFKGELRALLAKYATPHLSAVLKVAFDGDKNTICACIPGVYVKNGDEFDAIKEMGIVYLGSRFTSAPKEG